MLNLENNKIKSLLLRVSEGPNKGLSCPIGGLENLEELYLNNNRFKDLPTVFQNLKSLKILGLDWFSYIHPPHTLPKILEDAKTLSLLKQASEFHQNQN